MGLQDKSFEHFAHILKSPWYRVKNLRLLEDLVGIGTSDGCMSMITMATRVGRPTGYI